jgi:hypothetical protein
MLYLKLTYTLERTHLAKTCEAIEMNKLKILMNAFAFWNCAGNTHENPVGSQATYFAAKEVYDWLGTIELAHVDHIYCELHNN